MEMQRKALGLADELDFRFVGTRSMGRRSAERPPPGLDGMELVRGNCSDDVGESVDDQQGRWQGGQATPR